MKAYQQYEIEHAGRAFMVKIYEDTDMGMPWDEHDGHGIVTDWERRPKMPGEMILCEDGRSRRFYDFAASCKRALADGWDCPPYGQGTPRQRAARAAMNDFLRLRDFCQGGWHWCGIEVIPIDEDGGESADISASLWGIESDSDEYMRELAFELAAECLSQIETAGA